MLKDEFLERLAGVDFNEYFPVFNKEKLIIKKIGIGYIIALPNHQEVSANETLMDIFNFCNGENSVEKVFQEMFDLYDAPIDLLKKDIMSNLYDAAAFGLVVWKGGKNIFSNIYTYQYDKDITFSVTEASRIFNIINSNNEIGIKSSLYKPKVKYTTSKLEEAIRERETLYFDISHSNETDCLIGLTPVKDYSGDEEIIYYSVDYSYVNPDSKISVELFNKLMKWAVGFRNDGASNIVLEAIVTNYTDASPFEKIGFKSYGSIGDDVYFVAQIQ